ncbi:MULTISPECIES: hypothetical protein [Agrobacterium]|uniref:hypothetical protein n=1 Tax=Agrobacterium tumefaciens TaxID=358 RepID=UPI001572CEC9|nr:hypothetical protein [Agrobacterium tumefaciens]NSZ05619.1 hypothetical protein [Agrobacterium tumefaciens]
MSAIAAVIQPDAVHILSDGAFYDPETGIVTGLGCKVRKIPNVPAVYSSRGASIAFPIFESICETSQFRKFDEVVAVLPALLNLHDSYMKLFGKEGSEIVVAGWSESRNRGEIYARQSHSDTDQLARGECYKWTEGRVCFGVDWEDVPDPQYFTPAGAVEAFQRFRETPHDLHCGEREEPNLGYSVGGGVYHCEVTTDGASDTSKVHEWPEDVVGQKIEPFKTMRWLTGKEAMDAALTRVGSEARQTSVDHEPLRSIKHAA